MRPVLRACAASALMLVFATAAQAAPDKDFVVKAMQGDNSETRLGAIAARRGASAGVRDFGRMLRDDHSRAKPDAVLLARRLGVPPTDAMAPEARKEERRLQGLSGRRFDREFASYMVKDHRKDIEDFQREASNGANPRARALAAQNIPVLQKHLQTAQRLNRTL